MKKILAISIVLFAFTAATFAQATATSNASATIVGPIGIANTTAMNFGNVAVSATVPGTVVLDPAGLRTPTGGVTLPATAGTVAAAVFNVTGADGYTYAITLPATLTISFGAINMTVDTFTSTPSGTGSLAGGSQVLSVGATLNVAAAQAAGTYTSVTPFTVTVNYN